MPKEETEGIPGHLCARPQYRISVYCPGLGRGAGCQDIFIGVNAVDYSGYPDCRPEYIAAFEVMANLATRAGVEGQKAHIHTPLMDLMGKGDIIARGLALGVDYSLTVSCYQATEQGLACGKCDSCRLRRQGFIDAGVADPTRYDHSKSPRFRPHDFHSKKPLSFYLEIRTIPSSFRGR